MTEWMNEQTDKQMDKQPKISMSLLSSKSGMGMGGV